MGLEGAADANRENDLTGNLDPWVFGPGQDGCSPTQAALAWYLVQRLKRSSTRSAGLEVGGAPSNGETRARFEVSYALIAQAFDPRDDSDDEDRTLAWWVGLMWHARLTAYVREKLMDSMLRWYVSGMERGRQRMADELHDRAEREGASSKRENISVRTLARRFDQLESVMRRRLLARGVIR